MRTAFALATVAGVASIASAQIAQWNFNGTSSATVPGGATSPTPSIGTGTASLIGGTTGSFASGISNGGSSDPVITSPANFGWGTTSYPTAAAGNQTAGVQFMISTVGFANIALSYDLRHSNTSSRYEQVQYSLTGAGGPWISIGAAFDGNAGDTWFNGRTVDLSAVTGANDNPNFGIRIVSTFNGGAAYAASATTYAGTGTWRFDMVTLTPTPGAAALIGLGGLALSRRRRA